MKLSFSLKKKAEPPKPAASIPKPAVFGDNDAEEVVKPPVAVPYNVEASKAMQKRIEAEKQVDATVYEYDEVWDRIQLAKQKQKEAKEIESLERKPKYIGNLLNAAATRKLDHLRAEEKMMQREREKEGDEFKDKESFVTSGYKEQLEQMRKAEEEEKQREEMEKKKRGAATGMTHFYAKLLQESEQEHEAAVAATEKRVLGPQAENPSNLTITKPPDFTPTSDLELVRIAREQGKEVEVNDDGQIVDKRELLSAGLNLAQPNTRHLALKRALEAQKQQNGEGEVQVHRAVGTAASRKEINERRLREVQKQLEEEERRTAEKKRAEEQERLQRTVQKRNTTEDVLSAKERYLARKRARLEQAQNEGAPMET